MWHVADAICLDQKTLSSGCGTNLWQKRGENKFRQKSFHTALQKVLSTTDETLPWPVLGAFQDVGGIVCVFLANASALIWEEGASTTQVAQLISNILSIRLFVWAFAFFCQGLMLMSCQPSLLMILPWETVPHNTHDVFVCCVKVQTHRPWSKKWRGEANYFHEK